MRFTLAIASLLVGSATAATGRLAERDVHADIDADIKVDLDVNVAAALRAGAGFKCPSGMKYCPWTKSCSCAPGMRFDSRSKKCAGKPMVGAWPEPSTDVYASKGVELATYCAASPYRIVKYSPKHEYCQARLNTIAFVASAAAAVHLVGHVDVDIDIKANIDADLQAVVAGLAALYLEKVTDAVALFNTDAFGLATVRADVDVDVSLNLLGAVRGIFCAVGLAKCNFDCVSYCTKGCKNYIDADAKLGAGLEALVGLCILPKILLVNAAQAVVTVSVDGLLCLVGGLLKGLLGLFGCNCS